MFSPPYRNPVFVVHPDCQKTCTPLGTSCRQPGGHLPECRHLPKRPPAYETAAHELPPACTRANCLGTTCSRTTWQITTYLWTTCLQTTCFGNTYPTAHLPYAHLPRNHLIKDHQPLDHLLRDQLSRDQLCREHQPGHHLPEDDLPRKLLPGDCLPGDHSPIAQEPPERDHLPVVRPRWVGPTSTRWHSTVGEVLPRALGGCCCGHADADMGARVGRHKQSRAIAPRWRAACALERGQQRNDDRRERGRSRSIIRNRERNSKRKRKLKTRRS